MAIELTVINADINDKLPDLSYIQYDNNSRIIRFELTDRTGPNKYGAENKEYIDLTGCSVCLIAKKPSGNVVMQSGELLDAEGGQCQFALEQQVLTEIGDVRCQAVIFGANNERLSTLPFTIRVEASLAENVEITSSTELSALTEAITTVLAGITVVQLANRAAYDALENKAANTLYVWGQ